MVVWGDVGGVEAVVNILTDYILFFFFFKQKTAYEIVSRDWSSDVCSSDLDSLAIALSALSSISIGCQPD